MKKFKKFKKVQIDALLDAIYDEGGSPYVMVNAEHPGVIVPGDYVYKGGITMDLSVSAIKHFECNDDRLAYMASFGHQQYPVEIPYEAIQAVWPKGEPSLGLSFVEPSVNSKPVDHLDKPATKNNLIDTCQGTEPWRNPNADPNWAKSATLH